MIPWIIVGLLFATGVVLIASVVSSARRVDPCSAKLLRRELDEPPPDIFS